MIDSGQEPEILWRLITDQKRQTGEKRARLPVQAVYSHDSMQTWVQAVAASLLVEPRRPPGMKEARRQLEAAIRHPSYEHAPLPHQAPKRRFTWLPTRASTRLVLLLLILTALILILAGYCFRNGRQLSPGTAVGVSLLHDTACY